VSTIHKSGWGVINSGGVGGVKLILNNLDFFAQVAKKDSAFRKLSKLGPRLQLRLLIISRFNTVHGCYNLKGLGHQIDSTFGDKNV
jgi:hypothetical protein